MVAVALLATAVQPSFAAANGDPMIEGARLCTQYFPVEERKNNIPTHLLAAIATTESGVWHKDLGMSVPWPWTINVEGKGYHFDSKAQAIAQTQQLLRTGHESIDVGCMQVNLKHHANAFNNLDEAFEPKTNVAYAAKFLSTNYAEMGNWIKATAAYHSRTEERGQRYLVDIERSWNKIVSKVASARAASGAAPAASAVPIQVASKQFDQPKSVAMRPIRDTHNVKIIKVSDSAGTLQTSHQQGVLVIKAAPAMAAPTQIAEAAPVATVTSAPTTVALGGGDSVRRVSLSAPANPANTSGPKFVFAN